MNIISTTSFILALTNFAVLIFTTKPLGADTKLTAFFYACALLLPVF